MLRTILKCDPECLNQYPCLICIRIFTRTRKLLVSAIASASYIYTVAAANINATGSNFPDDTLRVVMSATDDVIADIRIPGNGWHAQVSMNESNRFVNLCYSPTMSH